MESSKCFTLSGCHQWFDGLFIVSQQQHGDGEHQFSCAACELGFSAGCGHCFLIATSYWFGQLTNVNRFLLNHSGKTLEGDGKTVYTLGAPIMESPVVPHLAPPDWADQIRWMASSAWKGQQMGNIFRRSLVPAVRWLPHVVRHDWNLSGATTTHEFVWRRFTLSHFVFTLLSAAWWSPAQAFVLDTT